MSVEIMIKKGNRNYVEKFLETFYEKKPEISHEKGLIKMTFEGEGTYILLDNSAEEIDTHLDRIKGFGDSKEYMAKVVLEENRENLENALKYFATSKIVHPSDIFLKSEEVKRKGVKLNIKWQH